MTPNEEMEHIRILLIEDDEYDSDLTMAALSEIRSFKSLCESRGRLSQGLDRLSAGGIHIVLLDLGLPDSVGFETFEQVYSQYPHIPTIILSGLADEDLAIRTVHEGAQDYLVKGHFDSDQLARSIRYAIERQKLKMELQSLSLVDELTGLYNRRGFLAIAKQQVKVATRQRKNLVLIYADMDNLKWINDTLGHKAGDRALRDMAAILNRTFRGSDVIGRMGGDEFAVLGIEESEVDFERMKARLERNISVYCQKEEKPYLLSMSVGLVPHPAGQMEDLEELLAKADRLMYEQKLLKKSRQRGIE